MTNRPELSHFLAALYDCAIAPGLWPRVLPMLIDFMESSRASIAARERTAKQPYFLVEQGIDEEVHERYVSKYRQINPRLPALAMFGVDEPVRTEDILDIAEFKRSTYYTEFHLPNRIGEMLGAKIVEDSRRIISCHVSRPQPYGQDDVEKFRELCPHIRRVMTIAELLEQRTVERDTLAQVLDRLAVAVILVDPKQRIVHANSAAEEVLAEGSPLSFRAWRADGVRLQNRLTFRRASEAPDLDPKSIPLATRDGQFVVVTVLPLTSGLRQTCAQPLTASAAVFVHHQPTFDQGLVTTLTTAFRLTGAEARVLAGLLEGLHIAAIAERSRHLRQHGADPSQETLCKDRYQEAVRPGARRHERTSAHPAQLQQRLPAS